MQYSNTTTKDGLLQDCEFWTNLGDAVITGDSTLKARFTGLLNNRYARVLAKLQLLSGISGAEDSNYADQQFSYFNIEEGTNDYQFLTDEDGNTITDITGVLIQDEDAAAGEDYEPLQRLALSDSDALLVMSPNTDNTGTPTGYIEKNNIIFFDKIPDYDKTNGGKLFYRLVPSYFTTSDTTKTPGFAENFHRILSLGASYDWLLVNKPENGTLITRIEAALKDLENDLTDYTRQKNPTRAVITPRIESSR